jgi:hypothetical protein
MGVVERGSTERTVSLPAVAPLSSTTTHLARAANVTSAASGAKLLHEMADNEVPDDLRSTRNLLVDYEDEDDPIPKLLSELPRRQLDLLTSLWGKDNVWWCVS